MRRLWPAIGVFALVAGCGRPNPGFKLIESGGGGDSESASSGSTDSGVVTGTPPTSTTTTGVTGTASSEGSVSATMSGTTGDTGGTTSMPGMHKEIPPSCDEALKTETFAKAAADTFFINEPGIGQCSFIGAEPDCRDMEFGKSGGFKLYLQADLNPIEERIGIYAVRFAQPMYEGIEITKDLVLGLEASIRLFGQSERDPLMVTLMAHRFASGDTWTAGEGLDFTTCYAPSASHRCRVCPAPGAEPYSKCSVDWAQGVVDMSMQFIGYPYDLDGELLAPTKVAEAPGPDGVDFRIPLAAEDLPDMLAEGLMVMPAINIEPGAVEIKTLDFGNVDVEPGLWVRHCLPIWVLDN